jgi:hypothetical protein
MSEDEKRTYTPQTDPKYPGVYPRDRDRQDRPKNPPKPKK